MKIRMITWNMGTNKNNGSKWKEEIKKLWLNIEQVNDNNDICGYSPLDQKCFDMLILTVQEDWL
jgi:hypothetical protein